MKETDLIDRGWKLKNFSDLTINLDNKRRPLSSMERSKKSGCFPYYGASGIVDYIDDFIFQEKLLLISEDGENLKTRKTPIAFFAEGKYWVNNHAHVVKNKPDVDLRFIKYWFDVNSISSFLSGSVQPKLSSSNLNAIQILVPNLIEQQEIATIISSLDEMIELNNQINSNLEKIANSLFRRWFIDFEFPNEEGRPYMSSGGKMIESELGIIPADWAVGRVRDIANLSKEGLSPNKFPEEAFDHYSIPAFDEGRAPRIEKGDSIQSNKFIVNNDCVLLSKLNPNTPRIWLPSVDKSRRAICSTEFLVLRPKNMFTREFLYCIFSDPSFIHAFGTMVTGTSGSHQRVRPESLMGFDILIPNDECVNQFTKLVKFQLERISANICESRVLKSLRDSILPRLMSGRIRTVN